MEDKLPIVRLAVGSSEGYPGDEWVALIVGWLKGVIEEREREALLVVVGGEEW